MTARVECLPRQTFLKNQLHMLGVAEESEQSVVVTFRGVGVELSIDEALELGLSSQDLKAAASGPQEYRITLTPIKPIKKEAPCGANNSLSKFLD